MTEQQQSGAATPPADRQRHREGLIIFCTALAVILFTFFETRLPQFSSGHSLTSNVIFFLLINLNIILLVLLVFLVARNLIKLIFERRQGILGANLRTRLVLAFVAVAILPAVMILIVAIGFMRTSIERWFNVEVERSLAGSLDVAQSYYTEASQRALLHARQVAERIRKQELLASEATTAGPLRELIEGKRAEYALGGIQVFGSRRQAVTGALGDDVPADLALGASSSLLSAALAGRAESRIESIGPGDAVRAAAPILGPGGIVGAVVVGSWVPESVARRSAAIARSFREYRQLTILKRPIINNYIVTLVLVSLLVVFSATWLGFYLAKGITVPIQKLAEGTREVAHGNWKYRIGLGDAKQVAPDDEFGSLVASFNQMTADLETSSLELERRRRYTETILANMTGGVVSVGRAGRITTMNGAAERLLGLDRAAAVGRPAAEVFAREDLAPARELLAQLDGKASHLTRELKRKVGGRVHTLVLTLTTLESDEEQALGAFLFIEDVSEIVKVQRMEAWREVARRIAHEIKNPLTPIQLSAQRLHKRYAERLRDDGALFDECTRTIVRQVEELKTLVNEFASFARLPAGEHTPESLNEVVDEAMVLFREAHRDIAFSFDADPSVPTLSLNREGIKRAVINILDNAVAACGTPNGSPLRIDVRTRYDQAHGLVALEIADSGSGIAADVRTRLFEPYVSTKPGGTGLGLAIVSNIVADHQGFVRVKDNEPNGSRFVVELPVKEPAGQVVLH